MKFFHIILMFLNCTSLYGIRFYLGHSHKKCLKEEIHKDVLVTGDHEIVGTEHQWLVDLTVSCSHFIYKKIFYIRVIMSAK